MKPTAGRIVWYVPDWITGFNTGDTDAEPKVLPAIIIDPLDGDRVLLGVFGRTYWTVTSIHQEPTPTKPAGPGTWHWPVKT